MSNILINDVDSQQDNQEKRDLQSSRLLINNESFQSFQKAELPEVNAPNMSISNKLPVRRTRMNQPLENKESSTFEQEANSSTGLQRNSFMVFK